MLFVFYPFMTSMTPPSPRSTSHIPEWGLCVSVARTAIEYTENGVTGKGRGGCFFGDLNILNLYKLKCVFFLTRMSTEYAKIKYIFFHTKNLLIFKIPVLLRNILLLKSMTIYIII